MIIFMKLIISIKVKVINTNAKNMTIEIIIISTLFIDYPFISLYVKPNTPNIKIAPNVIA